MLGLPIIHVPFPRFMHELARKCSQRKGLGASRSITGVAPAELTAKSLPVIS